MSDHQPDLEPSIPTPIEFDFVAFEARRAAQREDFLQRLVPLKAGLFAVLKSHGIIRVTAVFDGCGDSGQIDEMSAFNAEGPTEFPEGGIHLVDAAPELNGKHLAQSVSDAIETLAYDLLETHHGGWEINDGAYGEFVFDVEAQNINLEFNERYTATNLFEHEW